jgi:hypothetical protein
MTAEIINLSKARKAKARADKTAKAVQNRAEFGVSKAQKDLADSIKQKARRLLDQTKREKPPEKPGK